MRRALEQMGVPPSEIWTEETSHSTYQSAVLSSEMLRAKGVNKILLVTEAYHMQRAERSFRKQGLDVVPASCGFRHPLQGSWLEFLPDWQAIAWNEDNLHEIGGLAWYKISGRI
jgi:uncharacterized SAM-binding protein YcdF (DUF218 family)